MRLRPKDDTDGGKLVEGPDDVRALIARYAERFADAGNAIVSGMFALAFAVYATFAVSPEARELAAQHVGKLITVSLLGNLAFAFLLLRLGEEEAKLLRRLTSETQPAYAIKAAARFRIYLLSANTILYIFAIVINHVLRNP